MVARAFAAVLEAEGQVSEEQGFLKSLLLVLPKAACACVQDPVKAPCNISTTAFHLSPHFSSTEAVLFALLWSPYT